MKPDKTGRKRSRGPGGISKGEKKRMAGTGKRAGARVPASCRAHATQSDAIPASRIGDESPGRAPLGCPNDQGNTSVPSTFHQDMFMQSVREECYGARSGVGAPFGRNVRDVRKYPSDDDSGSPPVNNSQSLLCPPLSPPPFFCVLRLSAVY